MDHVRRTLTWVWSFVREDFDWPSYAGVFLFAAALLIFNYRVDFEDGYVDQFSNTRWYPVIFFAVHLVPWLIAVFIIAFFNGTIMRHKWTLVLHVLICFALLSIDRGIDVFSPIYSDMSRLDAYYYGKVLGNLNGFAVIGFGGFLLYLVSDMKHLNHFYGLSIHRPGFRPYLWMLIAVAVLAIIASFLPGFDSVYPKYEKAYAAQFADQNNMARVVAILIFEIAYLLDFVVIEFFFRGLLIFGLFRFLGNKVVLPMAVTYMVLHFGKPMGEAIGSFFGGYLLGVLAIKGERLWGGIILHMGLALGMEVVSALSL